MTARLERIQRGVDGRAAGRAVCRNSGRCCRFEQYGHRLYVTGLETASFLLRVEADAVAGDRAAPIDVRHQSEPGVSLPLLSPGHGHGHSLAEALTESPGVCPYQRDNLCTVHTIRPFGCRVFFCDGEGQPWMDALYERAHRAVRSLHRRGGLAYRFDDWRTLLAEGERALARATLD
ncbi:MAG: hypothetical protein AAF288_01920 [Planctomycetota bacterium]